MYFNNSIQFFLTFFDPNYKSTTQKQRFLIQKTQKLHRLPLHATSLYFLFVGPFNLPQTDPTLRLRGRQHEGPEHFVEIKRRLIM